MSRVKRLKGAARSRKYKKLGISRPKPKVQKTIYDRVNLPEEGAEFYNEHIQKDATKNTYWMRMYRKAITCLPPAPVDGANQEFSILDLGCGPGYFARVLYRDGYVNYLGIDFSEVCIRKAKKRVPNFEFMVGDLYDEEIQAKFADYDYILALEVLEHLERDKEVIAAIPSGKKIIVAVPNNSGQGHVRIFGGVKELKEWYADFIEFEDVATIHRGRNKVNFFLGCGTRK